MFVFYISTVVLCASVHLGVADSGNWGYGNYGDFGGGDFGSWGGNDGGDGGNGMWGGNPCNNFECQNDGECMSTGRGVRCICNPMFSGVMCEIFNGFPGSGAGPVITAMRSPMFHGGDLPDHLEHLGMAGFNMLGGQAPWAAQQYQFRNQAQTKLKTDPRPKQTNTVLNSMAPRRRNNQVQPRGQAGFQNPLQTRNPAQNAVNRRQNFQQPARNNMAARGQSTMMNAQVGMAPWGQAQGQATGYRLNTGMGGMPSNNPWGQQQQQPMARTAPRAAAPAWGGQQGYNNGFMG